MKWITVRVQWTVGKYRFKFSGRERERMLLRAWQLDEVVTLCSQNHQRTLPIPSYLLHSLQVCLIISLRQKTSCYNNTTWRQQCFLLSSIMKPRFYHRFMCFIHSFIYWNCNYVKNNTLTYCILWNEAHKDLVWA